MSIGKAARSSRPSGEQYPNIVEVREWMHKLENGQAVTNMLPRVVKGYEAAWRLAGLCAELVCARSRSEEKLIKMRIRSILDNFEQPLRRRATDGHQTRHGGQP